jgi:hypothetical protein
MSRFDEEHQRALFGTERAPSTMDHRLRRAMTGAPPTTAARTRRPRWAPALAGAATVLIVLGAAMVPRLFPDGARPGEPAASTTQSGHPRTPAPRADAANTGVPAGTSLTPHTGDLTVTQAGAVVDARLVTGQIVVSAPNVTIRRTRIEPPDGATAAVRQLPGATDLRLDEVEVAVRDGHRVGYGVLQEATGLTVRRSEIAGVDTGVQTSRRASVTGTFVHDLRRTGDAVGVNVPGGVTELSIMANTILAPATGTAAVNLDTDHGGLSGAILQENVLGGGEYPLRFGPAGTVSDVKVIHNRFSRDAWPGGGRDGPVGGWDRNARGNVWTANVWDDSGQLVEP